MSGWESLKRFVRESPWELWKVQALAVMKIEARRNLLRWRSAWIYLLAFFPVVVIGGHALESLILRNCSITEDTEVLAGIFQIYELRLAIFFGCMGLFTWLFRGDIVEKSLHYYFLAPMRREVLVVGKFLAGIVATTLVYCTAVLLSFFLMYVHFGPMGWNFVFNGPGLGQLVSYLWVTVLACIGYGSLFLALSLVFKNPVLPGLFVLLWETFHAVLPATMQKFSVMFYLKQLCPVSIPSRGLQALFGVIAEPVSPWLAVPGLLLLSAVILTFACFRIRKTEVSYLAD